jgi:hypothetical protein
MKIDPNLVFLDKAFAINRRLIDEIKAKIG